MNFFFSFNEKRTEKSNALPLHEQHSPKKRRSPFGHGRQSHPKTERSSNHFLRRPSRSYLRWSRQPLSATTEQPLMGTSLILIYLHFIMETTTRELPKGRVFFFSLLSADTTRDGTPPSGNFFLICAFFIFLVFFFSLKPRLCYRR